MLYTGEESDLFMDGSFPSRVRRLWSITEKYLMAKKADLQRQSQAGRSNPSCLSAAILRTGIEYLLTRGGLWFIVRSHEHECL